MFIEKLEYSLNPEKLIAYGFERKGKSLVYSVNLDPSGLILNLSVLNEKEIETELIDPESKEEYRLHKVLDSSGPFIGKVREEYHKVLDKIVTATSSEIKSEDEDFSAIKEYISKTYGIEPDYLWEKAPDTAAFRHLKTKKWFALITRVTGDKVSRDKSEMVPILVIRTDKGNAPELVDGLHYFPGYHMNKKNWITVLPNRLRFQELTYRIDESYRLTKGK